MPVALRHPWAFQTLNEITSPCFVSKHLVQKFQGTVEWDGGTEGRGGGGMGCVQRHFYSLGMCDE